MKLVIFAARLVLGLVFLVFGFNHIVPFIHAPMPTGDEGTWMGVMAAHKWFVIYGAIEVAAALMLLFGRFVALGLVLLGAVGFNILLYSFTFEPKLAALPVFLALLEILLIYGYRASFAGIFASKASPTL